MKFSDGQWLTRQGITVYNPIQVYDWEKDDNSITIHAPFHPIEDRANTVDVGSMTLRFFSPLPDVIGVQMWHFKGQSNRGPSFELHQGEGKAEITSNESVISLRSGNLRVEIGKGKEWSVDFWNDTERLTGSGPRSAAYVVNNGGIPGNDQTFMREQLHLSVGSYVYGLGERFAAFVKNGQTIDIWNEDGGTSSEQTYKNIPFYLTNQGYGVFVNHPEKISFEVASEKLSKVQFSVPGEFLEYYVINGPSPKQILMNYTALTGRPALPPAWSFGLWLTTSFTTQYDEETVNFFINGMAERDLPLHVFHFDCFWMKEFHLCDYQWDDQVFPEPEKMLARLKAKGLKICVWINPYIAQRSKLFDEGMANGYLLKKSNGDVWQWDRWQAGMAIVDFTNPKACQWFAGYLGQLVDMGVDCFKTDFGERIPTDVVYFDGSDPYKMHNYYTLLYNKVVYQLLEERLGKGKAAVFARSATVGSQQYPVHWGGDSWATYESMAESLRGGLSLCLSGFGFWSHDIGGFENTASADVYKRWVAFGLLSSHSRLHGSSSYRVPWLYDDEAVNVVRFFTKLKCRLMPYLFAKACEAATTGVPVMRAMMLEFFRDPACDYLDRQYMLGDSLLVAPVFSEDGEVTYYLPEGNWTHFLSGLKAVGGGWRKERYDFLSLPLFVRPNSIIAMGNNEQKPDYDYADGVTFHAFELSEGEVASTFVYNQTGSLKLKVSLIRRDRHISLQVEGAGKPWNIVFRGIFKKPLSVSGGWTEVDGLGLKLTPDTFGGPIELELAE
ncbi:MAG TPA: alpha-xylosidase [Firmicutes bacterium]|nr:alpha-xylosidase [Bacillota bacterium]